MKMLFVFFAVVFVSAGAIDFHSCPASQGTTGQATSVELSPCPSQPCNFQRGDTVNVKIAFTALNDSATLKATVYGIVLAIPVPFPLPNPDGCTNSGITCPLKKGQSYTYNSSFKVLDSYPEITVVVMWKLDGDSGNDVCFTFPISISAPNQPDSSIIG